MLLRRFIAKNNLRIQRTWIKTITLCGKLIPTKVNLHKRFSISDQLARILPIPHWVEKFPENSRMILFEKHLLMNSNSSNLNRARGLLYLKGLGSLFTTEYDKGYFLEPFTRVQIWIEFFLSLPRKTSRNDFLQTENIRNNQGQSFEP